MNRAEENDEIYTNGYKHGRKDMKKEDKDKISALFEKYEIELQEEATTKWSSKEERMISGFQLLIIRKFHKDFDEVFKCLIIQK